MGRMQGVLPLQNQKDFASRIFEGKNCHIMGVGTPPISTSHPESDLAKGLQGTLLICSPAKYVSYRPVT